MWSANRTNSARKALTLIVASAGSLMAVVDVTIVNVALPSFARGLHAGVASLQWIVNAYTIPQAVLLLTAGKLSDIYGRKRLFLIGLATFTFGSAICASTALFEHAFAPMSWLLFGRAVQGAGSAVLAPVSLAIVNEAFHGDEKERTTAVGVRGAMVGLGLALGPVLGGILLSRFSWNSIFLVNLPVGIGTLLLAWQAVDESRDPHASTHIDLFGLLTLSIAVLLTVGGLVTTDLAMLATGLGLFVAFVFGELRVKEPLYDLHLFENRSFSGAAGAVFCSSAAILGLLFFLTLYLQNVLRFSPLKTGISLLPLTLTVLVVSPVAGRLTSTIGPRALICGGLACGAAGVAILHSASTAPDWWTLVPAFACIGAGLGFANPPIVAVATGTVEHERAGLAAGLNTVCRQIGTAVGVALISAFFGMSHGFMAGFHTGTIASAVLLLAGAAIAFAFVREATSAASYKS